ncbi:MAG: DNA primase [Lentisphaeria bacterium]|nr:DNA primase [Lentisphaeria bacterium]
MGRSIPEGVIEEIRSRCDIVDVVGSYLPLKRAGTGTWKACCPFHNEKTPSFHVQSNRQSFHCFGCGKGGDVFRFVMERENVPFPEAAHLLASRCGVIIPENSHTDPGVARERANTRDRLYSLNEEFARFFEHKLHSCPDSPAAQYLATRQLAPEWIRQFRLGAAPDGWDDCLRYGRSLGFSDEEMLTGGIIRKAESGRLYDHFRGRLTFAIWNEQGKVVGFSARSLEAKPEMAKYVNTPETPVFKKGMILYALPFARKAMQEAGEAILCEGQLDTIAMHRAGLAQSMAPQGTGFTPEQAKILRRYGNKVTLAFDSDTAGQKAVRAAIEILLPLELDVQVMTIPGGKDPDELYRTGGADAILQAHRGAADWITWLCGKCAERFDMSSVGGKSSALAEIVQLLMLLENPIRRELSIRQTASLLGVDFASIAGEIARQEKMQRRRFAGAGNLTPGKTSPPVRKSGNQLQEKAERTLLEIALADEDQARYLAESLDPEMLQKSLTGRVLNAVLAAALNGEHASAGASAVALLQEDETGELSAIFTRSECSYAPDVRAKAVQDCLKALGEAQRGNSREKLLAELRSCTDPERQMAILQELGQIR